MPRRRKFLSGSLAILAAVSMIGVYAAFTESVSTQTQNITTASGTGLVLTAGSLQATVNSSVADLVPTDWVTRPVTITNETTYALSAVSLSVGDSFPGAAFTSSPEGLKMTVEEESSPGSGSWSTIYGPATSTGTDLITNIGGGVLTAGGATSLRITQTFVGPNTSKSLKGAEADLTYTFDGAQRAGSGGSVAAPVAPTNVTSDGVITPTTAGVAWDSESGVDHFHVVVTIPDSQGNEPVAQDFTLPGSASSTTLTGLTDDVCYNVYVTAVNSAGQESDPNVSGTSICTNPLAPYGVSAAFDDPSDGYADISWNNDDSSDLTWNVSITGNDGYSSLDNTTSSTDFVVPDSLTSGTVYTVDINSVSSTSGNSSATTQYTFTMP